MNDVLANDFMRAAELTMQSITGLMKNDSSLYLPYLTTINDPIRANNKTCTL